MHYWLLRDALKTLFMTIFFFNSSFILRFSITQYIEYKLLQTLIIGQFILFQLLNAPVNYYSERFPKKRTNLHIRRKTVRCRCNWRDLESQIATCYCELGDPSVFHGQTREPPSAPWRKRDSLTTLKCLKKIAHTTFLYFLGSVWLIFRNIYLYI